MPKIQNLKGGLYPPGPPNRGAASVPRQGPVAPWIPAYFLRRNMVKFPLGFFPPI